MEFGLLGPLRVAAGGGELAFPARQRTVLAVLLLRANQIVTVEALAGVLWDGVPPQGARNTVQGYVKLIRQRLGPQESRRLVTRGPGYLLTVTDGEVDADRFTTLCDEARAAADRGDWAGAAGRLAEALALWRGEPIADVPAPMLARDEVPRLVELRLTALEARIDADLRLGRHAGLVGELRQLSASHPLRERFSGQLMLALYGCGRQAEALAAFRQARQVLRDELGIEPGPELTRLHERMLAGDPELSAAAEQAGDGPRPAAEAAVPDAPAQLPPDTVDFTGREPQVGMLYDLLAAEPDARRPGAVVISAVSGMGGIGKTALAVHAAHRLSDRFPDGQLYVGLQGASRPLGPGEVLARFLRALGVPDAAIPADDAERAARYRTEIAGRRMLLVLDDARDAAQVRPLLPGTAGCGVIVTSRSTQPGLGLAGAVLLDLDVLAPAEAHELFTAIAGPARTAAEPDAVASVLESCAGLPLAVRIAASRLRSRPGWSIAHLATRLADERLRLAELASGDLGIRASFGVSYEALPAGPALVFRRLGLADATELPLAAIAALAGLPVAETAAALEILTDAHLASSPAPDRFRQHDLLRSYAAEVAAREEPETERQAAVGRLLRWYGDQAILTTWVLEPTRRFPAAVLPQPAAEPQPVTTPARALAWFEAELPGLVAAARQASRTGQHDVAAQISAGLWDFFQRAPYAEEWVAASELGVRSARQLGDDAVLSWMLTALGAARNMTVSEESGRDCLEEALVIRRRAGDRAGEAAVLNSLGVGLSEAGRYAEALDYLEPSVEIFVSLGSRLYEGLVLSNAGGALLGLKRYDEALDYLERALAINTETGERHGQGLTESKLGHVYLDLGRLDEAVAHYRQALAALDDTEIDHEDQADVLVSLGQSLARLGRPDEARQTWLTALPILDRLRDPRAAPLRDDLAGLRSGDHSDTGSAKP
jgi:DNA-binding SARP family transcriptional activator/Tfp pilus assembly protein PilF